MGKVPLRVPGMELFSPVQNGHAPSPFVCPGSSQPVSRAVHLSRLNAAWPECDQCEWRHDTEGLADRTVQATERIRDNRAEGIRRTEFGVRGQYINDIDRRTAADLARIFCRCLNERPASVQIERPVEKRSRTGVFSISNPRTDSMPSDNTPSLAAPAPVVVGYDGRNSSPDIFVGVTAAVREFGLPVIDVGRCTAASIQEAVRSFPESSGAILITGADSPTSWTGLDAFDQSGDPLPVVWKDFGIRLQHITAQVGDGSDTDTTSAAACRVGQNRSEEEAQQAEHAIDGLGQSSFRDDVVSEMLERIRRDTSASLTSVSKGPASSNLILKLQLPPREKRLAWQMRLSRSSGDHSIVDFEDRYRQWLARWFPARSSLRIQVRTDDALIRQRLIWISESTGMEIIVRGIHEPSDLPLCRLTMTIAEDDRQFQITNATGLQMSSEQLAKQLNAAIHSQASQVTAHSDLPTGRFWLTDAGRPTSGGQTEQIRDAVAALGLVVKLIELGRLVLHS